MPAADDDKFNQMLARLREQSAARKAEKDKKPEEKPPVAVSVPVTPVVTPPVVEKPVEKVPEKVPEKTPEVVEKKEVPKKVEEVAKKPEEVKKAPCEILPVREATLTSSLGDVIQVISILKDIISAYESVSKKTSKGGRMRVNKTFSEKGELIKEVEGDSTIIETPEFVGPTATVSADFGATINLGDYNSTKINVFISVPCYPTEIDNAFKFARNKAEELLKKECESIKAIR